MVKICKVIGVDKISYEHKIFEDGETFSFYFLRVFRVFKKGKKELHSFYIDKISFRLEILSSNETANSCKSPFFCFSFFCFYN